MNFIKYSGKRSIENKKYAEIKRAEWRKYERKDFVNYREEQPY